MALMEKHEIRKLFAQRESEAFAREVPEYTQFTEIVRESNEEFLRNNPDAHVDSENRVLAEKHGAIRVGTEEEMRMVTRIFAVMGMHPVEFYDMTALPKGALPMIATAFRPIDETIEKNAFRMFCSMLHPEYIPDSLKPEVEKALANRHNDNPKFSKRLTELLKISETGGGLTTEQGKEFVGEVIKAFSIDKSYPIDFNLYKRLREVNDVLADIVCVRININHLTPRAYDIRDAANRLIAAGIPMKDGGIEGPPIRDEGVIIQLNQTSRKAPGEELVVAKGSIDKLPANPPKVFLEPDQAVTDYLAKIETALETNNAVIIQHKARFGEIESRGVALTAEGESLYKSLLAEKKFGTSFPKTHDELFTEGLAYYTIAPTQKGIAEAGKSDLRDILSLYRDGLIKIEPQTYDDFLAASAAGIFKSNMSTGTSGIIGEAKTSSLDNKARLEKAMGREIVSRHDLHQAKLARSVVETCKQLGIKLNTAEKLKYERVLDQSKCLS